MPTISGSNLDMVGFVPSLGYSPWNAEMEKNLRAIDKTLFGAVIGQRGFISDPQFLDSTILPNNNIGIWNGSSYDTYTPIAGWRVYISAESVYLRYTGSAWVPDVAQGSEIYIHTQTLTASVWVIDHNFGREPVADVYNQDGELVEASVVATTVNTLTITFNYPTRGKAVLR